jgi:formyl-CoA transferase
MCAALAAPELAQPPYADHPSRMRHRGELRTRVAQRVAQLELDELARRLRDHDVPLDPVRTADEVLADPHLNARGMFSHTASGTQIEYPVVQGGRRSFAEVAAA